MGSVSVFHLHLVCGRHRINLICHRAFNGDYILEGDEFRTSIAASEARGLCEAGNNLHARAEIAKTNGGLMKPGPVFERELPIGGILEFGVVPSGGALYMNLGDVHVVFEDEQQVAALKLALLRLREDVALTTLGNALGLAQTPGYGPIQSSVIELMRHSDDPRLPAWARDGLWK